MPEVRDHIDTLVHRGVIPSPGLYSLGQAWQHTRGSGLLGFVADDASHIAGHIAGDLRGNEPAAAARPPDSATPAPRQAHTRT